MWVNLRKTKMFHVDRVEELKHVTTRPSLFQKKMETTECSMCHLRMSKHTGDQQIANKRKNAPICIPCILGKPRKKKGESIYYRRAEIVEKIKSGEVYKGKKDNAITRRKELDELSNR